MGAPRAWPAGLALLLAACAGGSDDFLPTAPEVAGALTLTASVSSVPADGVSRVRLLAQIDPDADPDKRTVVFTTSAGELVGSGGAPLEVPADDAGRAEAELKSATEVGTARVTAAVKGVEGSTTRVLSIEFTPADASAVVRLTLAASRAPADGASRTEVVAELAPGIPEVVFSTSAGSFGGGGASVTVPADASARAFADLVSPAEITTARITASAGGFSAFANLEFVRALPDDVLVATDTATLAADASASALVTATLLRDTGTVTANTEVRYAAVDAATGADLGLTFRNVSRSDTAGVSTAQLVAGATSFRGTARVRVTVPGSSAVGEETLEITD